ncbi:MAG: 30S ribosomal protein S17e [Thermoprotei archaeon]|nr:MAG: 30S ribosomal protein S17e [Thermoprotei archaeon]RLF16851.1 MAG: 30S ribosomal protein S17e [Thermoprotei archaeon]
MGKVRSGVVKSMARRLLTLYGDRFTSNFEENKRLVSELTTIRAKHLRNRVAGYITRLVKMRSFKEEPREEAEQNASSS